LFYVKNISSVFNAKFREGLGRLRKEGKLKYYKPLDADEFVAFMESLKTKKWVVNIKAEFNGKQSVIEYLGRYSHRIAISNCRLLSLNNGVVNFSYRDRKAGDVKKTMSLPVKAFLLRFSQHILPKRFVKIRHYGIFSSRAKKQKLKQIKKSLNKQTAEKKKSSP
jgi:hypothetical protein